MNRTEILHRAASLMSGPGAYSPKATAAACVASTGQFSASSALERSARCLRSGSAFLGPSHPTPLAAAKAAVCRVVGFPHIDLWEWHVKPDWLAVKAALEQARSAA